MANYYSQFSIIVERITPDERAWLETRLQALADDEDRDQPLFAHAFEDNGDLWLHDGDGEGSIQLAAGVLSDFLEAHRPDQVISFSWADTCSKPRPDAYGGGAVVITAEGAEWFTISDWIAKAEGAALARLKKTEARLILLVEVYVGGEEFGAAVVPASPAAVRTMLDRIAKFQWQNCWDPGITRMVYRDTTVQFHDGEFPVDGARAADESSLSGLDRSLLVTEPSMVVDKDGIRWTATWGDGIELVTATVWPDMLQDLPQEKAQAWKTWHTPPLPVVRIIELPGDGAVLVDRAIVYTEDRRDGDYSNKDWPASRMGKELAKALGTEALVVDLAEEEAFLRFMADHGIDVEEWTYVAFAAAVLGIPVEEVQYG